MVSREEMINEACQKIGDDTSSDLKKAVKNVMTNVFDRGMLPKDAMGMSDSLVEGIYGHAYRLYNAGQYQEAQNLFRLLVMLNATEAKYILGSAACYHMTKDYANAAATYAIVSMADPNTPIPHYHAADCYLKMDLLGAAMNELESAVQLCGDKAPYALIRDRAQMMLERIKSGEGAGGTEEASEAGNILPQEG